jgi:hypothetical protein
MAEQKTAQQQVREQYKVAENVAENMLRGWNDLTETTATLTFDVVEQSLRYNQEARAQTDRALQDAIGAYRRMYQEGLKTWQSYIQNVNGILTRVN